MQERGLSERPVEDITLAKLNLDTNNPRFGATKGKRSNQTDILDFIVENFGVDDVIYSLAYNGYFQAEPLIARENGDGTYTVVEGNRRLSACLILSGSDRARNQRKKRDQVEVVTQEWNEETTTVPVQVYGKDEDTFKLNSYLGVRHIMAAKAWDSYAKAAWIDQVVSNKEMTLDQICEVTGDKNRTIRRLLEGYYFINQLKDEGYFSPENSIRKGRGSNPEFPFSWVYTLLDYNQVRKFVGLDDSDPTNNRPVPVDRLGQSAKILYYMFGDRSKGQSAAIEDSRQLGGLASAIGDVNKRHYLDQGKKVSEIEVLSQPPVEQLSQSLTSAYESLNNAMRIVSAGSLEHHDASEMLPRSKEVTRLSQSLYRAIRDIDDPEDMDVL